MMIAKCYVESLGVDIPDDFTLMPSEICLCTHIDIGKIGNYSNKVFAALPYEPRYDAFAINIWSTML